QAGRGGKGAPRPRPLSPQPGRGGPYVICAAYPSSATGSAGIRGIAGILVNFIIPAGQNSDSRNNRLKPRGWLTSRAYLFRAVREMIYLERNPRMMRNSLRYCLALGLVLGAAGVARSQTSAALGQPKTSNLPNLPQSPAVD